MSNHRQPIQSSWEGEMLRLLIENIQDCAIFIMDASRHVLTWNRGSQNLLGYEEQEILGESADKFFLPEDIRAGLPEQEIQRALAAGKCEDDRWHLRKDGSPFWSSGMVTPLRDETGTLRGFAKIMRDRTDLKKVQVALEEQNRLVALSAEFTKRLVKEMTCRSFCSNAPRRSSVTWMLRSPVFGSSMSATRSSNCAPVPACIPIWMAPTPGFRSDT